jgi:acetyl esterase
VYERGGWEGAAVTVTPAVKAFVDAMTAAFPDIGGAVTDPEEARRIIAAQRAERWLDLPEIEMAHVRDRTIPGPVGSIPVREYRPSADGASPQPVVVFFHGGGWVIGDLETHDRLARRIARDAGCLVVAVHYRRAPEHRYPAAADDAYAATAWVAEHAAELGADPDRLAVVGDSAGGNLAAVVAHMARDRGGPPIAFQLLVYPVIDHSFETDSYRDNAEGWMLTAKHMRWYWDQYLGPDGDGADPYASPLRGDLAGLPPAHVVTAEYDPLRDEGDAYADALRAAGVDVTLQRADGMWHGFLSVAELLADADPPTRETIAALRDALT